MKTIEIISQDVFDKVRSRFTNLQMGDENGGVTMDPRKARFYDFDFTIEGHNLGRVSVSINELGTLKVFYGQSILEDIDPISKEYWYDFLREMRMFAKRRLLRFDTRDITKSNLDKDDFAYLANNGSKEDDNMNMNESVKFEGSSKTSYGKMQKAKVIAKHHTPITDESHGARKRAQNIKALYVENEDGERFKYPFIHTAGALAMAQHVAHGGRPYDDQGNSIIGMSEQISQCVSALKHMGRHDSLNQEAHQIAERVHQKLESLRNSMKSIAGPKGYRAWAEGFEPIANGMTELDQATMEDYKSKFTQSSFKEELAQFFPLIHGIMKETGTIDLEDLVHEGSEENCDECGMLESDCECDDTVKEDTFSNFEDWAERLAEGQLAMDTVGQLHELLSNGTLSQVGIDGTATIEALQGIGIDDESLETDLSELAKSTEGSGDPTETILGWLQRIDPTAYTEITSDLGGQQDQAEQPAQQDPAQQVPAEQPVAEENEDEMHDKEDGISSPSMRELAQWLCGHYNATYKEEGFESPWRKGPTELGTMASKEFGPEYSELVKKLMGKLGHESPLNRMHREKVERESEMEDMEASMPTSRSPVPPGGADKPSGGGKLGWTEDDAFEDVLRLAGLKK
jgi:DNA-binding ferritin-like protein